MRRNWIAGGLGAMGLVLIGYAGLSGPDPLAEASSEPVTLLPGAPEYYQDDLAGEVPLFESVEPVSARDLAVSMETEELDPFTAIPADHWVLTAMQGVFPHVDSSRTGEVPEEVTRYELAVALAKAFEAYERGDGPEPDDLSKLALMEKLGRELRQELAMLGVDSTRVAHQLEELSGRVGQNEAKISDHTGRIDALEKKLVGLQSKLSSQEVRTAALVERVDSGDGERAKLTERNKAVSQVVSRLVVKTSVAQARLGDLQEKLESKVAAAGQVVSPMATTELAARVSALEKSERPVGAVSASGELVARLKRLERLVVRVYDQSGEGAGLSAARELMDVKRTLGRLATRVEKIDQAGDRGPGTEKALGDVKVLLKDFFTDFSERLGRVEREVF